MVDLHGLQHILLETCKENISLNVELQDVRDELRKKDAKIQRLKVKVVELGGDAALLEEEDEDDSESDSDDESSCHSGSSTTSSITQSPDEYEDGHADDELGASCSIGSITALRSTDSHSKPTTLVVEQDNNPAESSSNSFSVHDAVEDLQRWFFSQGGMLQSVREFIDQYANYLRNAIGVPLERVFVGELLGQANVSVHVWKWEHGQAVDEHTITREAFENGQEIFSKSPFGILHQRKADFFRMKACEIDKPQDVPEDCQWFVEEKFQDFYALPILQHDGEFVGAVSWSTKDDNGFSSKHVEFFGKAFSMLASFLRLHTNDIILTALASQLEDEVAERTRELASANERIMQQSRAQIKNFAMMSHEIRTPLNCIIGLSSLLVDTELDKNQQESLRMIVRSGDLLLSVVNDVLDYSRLESGNIDFHFEPTDLRSVAELVLHSMAPKIKARKITIDKSFDKLPSSLVQTDGSRLQQILYNLLGNSCKFSREGGTIEFTMQLVESSLPEDASCSQFEVDATTASTKMVHISVKDFGKGIAKGDLENIFEPFNQGAGGTGRTYGGTGLGLAITANLVKGLNGSISVDSEQGKWAKFVVQLPFVEVPRIDPGAGESSNAMSQAANNNGDYDDDKTVAASGASPNRRVPGVTKRTSGIVMDRRMSLSRSDSGVSTCSTHSNSRHEPRALTSPAASGATTESPQRSRNSQQQQQQQSQQFIAQQVRILVVDDNMVNRKVLVRMLNRIGAKSVDTAENGLEAVEKEVENTYDLILMDMEMPVMDGLQATRTILSRPRNNNNSSVETTTTAGEGGGTTTNTCAPKVVFVTAHALDTYHAQAVAAGGSGFLTKPFNLKKLTSVFKSIDMHLGCRQITT